MCREPADELLAFGILREDEVAAVVRALDACLLHLMKDLQGSSN
jgi:hypothetical protein